MLNSLRFQLRIPDTPGNLTLKGFGLGKGSLGKSGQAFKVFNLLIRF